MDIHEPTGQTSSNTVSLVNSTFRNPGQGLDSHEPTSQISSNIVKDFVIIIRRLLDSIGSCLWEARVGARCVSELKKKFLLMLKINSVKSPDCGNYALYKIQIFMFPTTKYMNIHTQ